MLRSNHASVVNIFSTNGELVSIAYSYGINLNVVSEMSQHKKTFQSILLKASQKTIKKPG